MDEESFISNTNDIIQHMFLDTKTAAFLTESAGKSSEEYSNCQVSSRCCNLGKHCSCTVYQPTVTLYINGITQPTSKYKQINAQIEDIWSYTIGDLSIAYTNGLPYGIFLKKVIYDITLTGHLHRIKSKWQSTRKDCSSSVEKALSIEKLVSLFIIPCLGFTLAVIIIIFELWYNSMKKSSPMMDQIQGPNHLLLCLIHKPFLHLVGAEINNFLKRHCSLKTWCINSKDLPS